MQTAEQVGLTGKRAQVWDLLVQGKAPKDIAGELGMGRNAVYQHVSHFRHVGLLPNDRSPRRRKQAPARGNGDTSAPAQRPLDRVASFMQECRADLDRIEHEEREHEAAMAHLREQREQVAKVLESLEPIAREQ